MRRAAERALVAGAVVAFAVFVASGCGPAVDPAKLAAVQVAGADASLRGCRLLGPLEGRDSDRWVPGGPRYETAMLDLRKKAVLGGGNQLVTDSIEPPRDGDYTPTFVVRARLFACASGTDGGAAAQPIKVGETPKPAVVEAPRPAVAEAPRPPPPASQAICEPDCSPGYTCLRGTCVSACNPLCAGGERCGVDRMCHPRHPASASRSDVTVILDPGDWGSPPSAQNRRWTEAPRGPRDRRAFGAHPVREVC